MRLTTPIRKISAWQFITFGSGGLSVGVLAGGGGQMILKAPSGTDQTFTYGGVGEGLSAGLKIPKLGKIQVPTPKGPAPALRVRWLFRQLVWFSVIRICRGAI